MAVYTCWCIYCGLALGIDIKTVSLIPIGRQISIFRLFTPDLTPKTSSSLTHFTSLIITIRISTQCIFSNITMTLTPDVPSLEFNDDNVVEAVMDQPILMTSSAHTKDFYLTLKRNVKQATCMHVVQLNGTFQYDNITQEYAATKTKTTSEITSLERLDDFIKSRSIFKMDDVLLNPYKVTQRKFLVYDVVDVGRTLRIQAGIIKGNNSCMLNLQLEDNKGHVTKFNFSTESTIHYITFPYPGIYVLSLSADSEVVVELNLSLETCGRCGEIGQEQGNFGTCIKVYKDYFTYSYCRCKYDMQGQFCLHPVVPLAGTIDFLDIVRYSDYFVTFFTLIPLSLALYRGLGPPTIFFCALFITSVLTSLTSYIDIYKLQLVLPSLHMVSMSLTLAVSLISSARLSPPLSSAALCIAYLYCTTWSVIRAKNIFQIPLFYKGLLYTNEPYFLLTQCCGVGAVIIGCIALVVSRKDSCTIRNKLKYTRMHCFYYLVAWVFACMAFVCYYERFSTTQVHQASLVASRFCVIVAVIMTMPNPRKAYLARNNSFNNYDVDQSSDAPFLGNYNVKRSN